jgi:hypothetical protein
MPPSPEQLADDLRRALDDKDALAAQHHALVAKVATIRNTLGAKLQQDAVSRPSLPSPSPRLSLPTGRTRPPGAAHPAPRRRAR